MENEITKAIDEVTNKYFKKEKMDFPALVKAAWVDAVEVDPELANRQYSKEAATEAALDAWDKYYDELVDLYVVAVQEFFKAQGND